MVASVKVNVMVACNQGYEARARGTPFQNCLYSNRRALRAFTGWMAGLDSARSRGGCAERPGPYHMGIHVYGASEIHAPQPAEPSNLRVIPEQAGPTQPVMRSIRRFSFR